MAYEGQGNFERNIGYTVWGGLQDYGPDWMRRPGYWLRNKFGGGGGEDNSHEAADKFAQLTRDQWDQWVNQFLPIEKTLIDYASDVTMPGQEATKAIGNVQAAFGQQSRASDLSMKTAGIQLNPDEQRALDRDRQISQSLAEVSAANSARQLTVDRQRSIAGAPMNTSDLALRGGR